MSKTPRLAPNGQYVNGSPRMCPDGTYVGDGGAISLAPMAPMSSGDPVLLQMESMSGVRSQSRLHLMVHM
jgi:hypothetical protein